MDKCKCSHYKKYCDYTLVVYVHFVQIYTSHSLCSTATLPNPEAEAAKAAAGGASSEASSNDWMFLNYTYKRFDGLTQRGRIPAHSSYTHS